MSKSSSISKMLDHCSKSVAMLPDFVSATKSEFKRFDIRSIPAIETGCRFWSALNDQDALAEVSKTVRDIPELRKSWSHVVDTAFENAKLATRIQTQVHENPGVLQKDVPKLLGVTGSETRDIIYTLICLGKISATKVGNSNALKNC